MNNGPEHFSGSLQVDGGEAVISLAGVVQAAGNARLCSLIDEAVVTGTPRVVVDLADVALIDATSLEVLLQAAYRLSRSGARLAVRRVPPRIALRLKVAGVADVLGVEPSPDEAGPGVPALGLPPTAGTHNVLDAALKLVVTMAQAVVSGAEGVSITLPRDGRLRTVAASNDVVLEMDHDQYDTHEGPCWDAATQGERFHIKSLSSEQRWPAFVPRARARGIETILSAPLVTEERPIGALNLYSRMAGAFAEHEKRWADQFAAEASQVVASALPEVLPAMLGHDVQHALFAREVIAQAQGFVMHRDGVTATAAYAQLRELSIKVGTPLRDLCRQVVTAGDAAADAAADARGADSPAGADCR